MARPHCILDTTIVIDLILQSAPALTWAHTVQDQVAAITSVTIMEVLKGAQNKRELASLGRELSRFQHLQVLKQDSEWAVRQFRAFWLSHRIGINDCFIGAIASRTQLPLYTLNIRDFAPLPDIAAVRPY